MRPISTLNKFGDNIMPTIKITSTGVLYITHRFTEFASERQAEAYLVSFLE